MEITEYIFIPIDMDSRKMKTLFWAILLILLPNIATASAECSQVSDNLERLSCYDGVWKNVPASSVIEKTPNELFLELQKLVEKKPNYLLYFGSLQDGSCRLVNHINSVNFTTKNIVNQIFVMPLDKMDTAKIGLGAGPTIKMTTIRDSEISESWVVLRTGSMSVSVQGLEVAFAYGGGTEVLENSVAKVRSHHVPLAAGWPEDRNEILEKFKELVVSCQK